MYANNRKPLQLPFPIYPLAKGHYNFPYYYWCCRGFGLICLVDLGGCYRRWRVDRIRLGLRCGRCRRILGWRIGFLCFCWYWGRHGRERIYRLGRRCLGRRGNLYPRSRRSRLTLLRRYGFNRMILRCRLGGICLLLGKERMIFLFICFLHLVTRIRCFPYSRYVLLLNNNNYSKNFELFLWFLGGRGDTC